MHTSNPDAEQQGRQPSVREPRLIDRFTLWCKLRYRFRQAFGRSAPFWAVLNTGEQIQIRPSGTDWSVAIEVFANEVYRLPKELEGISIRRIIDIGGNVGYTSLYWARRLPEARILAFEPHPENVAAFMLHLTQNGIVNRVEILPVAAGVREATVTLHNCGSGSSIVIQREQGAGNSFNVPMIDWIPRIGSEPIDLLKMDIEGGEYDLLADPRFEKIQAKIVVLEWHTVPSRPARRKWCLERLIGFGYRIVSAEDSLDKDIGMVWAVRD
jgi:FkbM family methyltransferase